MLTEVPVVPVRVIVPVVIAFATTLPVQLKLLPMYNDLAIETPPDMRTLPVPRLVVSAALVNVATPFTTDVVET